MKIKMTKTFQGNFNGAEVGPLQDGKIYPVGSGGVSQELANFLLKRHAKLVEGEKEHYGSQPLGDEKPSLEEDDKLSERVKKIVGFGISIDEASFEDSPIVDDFKEMQEILNKAEDVPRKETDATPSALKFAKKKRVDLKEIEGTGSGGRVTLTDVQKYLENREQK